MALATRCPGCSTIFRISTAQAAAKGGMVRCGQCRNVFNSLDALVRVEDLDLVDEAVVEVAVPVPDGAAAHAALFGSTPYVATGFVGHDEAAEALDAGFEDSEVSDVLASLSAATEDHSTQHAWWMPDPSGRREPSTVAAPASLHDPMPPEPSLHEPLPPPRSLHDPLPRPASSMPLAQPRPPASPQRSDDAAGSEEADLVPWSASDSGTGPVFMQPAGPAEPTHPAARWTWGILSLVALLLLLAQLAYMQRDELAARWPPARPWLITACSMLRCKVDHPAHAESITIESVTVQSRAADANLYVLNALLRNRDSIDVRYPYLELVLTDVQDRTVMRRVLRPEDYATLDVDPQGFASSGFPAQSELPVKLTFELDDLRFTGYRLDRFYP